MQVSNGKLDYSRGEIISAKYEVLDKLDESPLGATYRVKHMKSGKFVRLTLLRPEHTDQLEDGKLQSLFRQAKDHRNPHLVRLGELGDSEGVSFITWEDFESKTLLELMHDYKVSNKNFSLKETAQVINQVLDGLASLHANDTVFRALRPEHILVNVRYAGPRQQNFVAHAKLFGAYIWDIVPTASLIEDEFTRGSAQYLAPEIKSHDPSASGKSDIYAAGTIMYQMLSGVAPEGTFIRLTQLRPNVPKLIDDVVELSMSPHPDDRYGDPRDLAQGLQRVVESAATEPTEEANTTPMLMMVVAICALLVIIATGVAYLALSDDQGARDELEDIEARKAAKEAHKMPTQVEFEAMTARHPSGMVYVPEGPFVSGRLNIDEHAPGNEPKLLQKSVDAFMIDIYEYPNTKGEGPTNDVTWEQAKGMCEEAGKRLCTADEWEKACKGLSSNIYSYGDTFDSEFCGSQLDPDFKSGSLAQCTGGWGTFDMSGGLREWTASEANSDSRRIVKGGMEGNQERGSRCAYSTDDRATYADSRTSFRCCRDADAPPVAPPAPAPADTDAATEEGSSDE